MKRINEKWLPLLAILAILFMSFTMWLWDIGNDLKSKKLDLVVNDTKIVKQDSILFVKKIQQGIDSGFVFVVKTSDSVIGEYGSRLEDVAGNDIKPFSYYYYVKGHLIQKRWSMNSSEYNSKIIKMMIKRNIGSLHEGLEVEVFDVKINPSQIVIE